MADRSTSNLGELGEAFVAQWLQTQNYQLLYRRWRCRLGELDLVMITADRAIACVEVKTRSAGNWDLDGLLAVSHRKQEKLWQTAELFLATHPQFNDRAVRFDVALVHCGKRRPLNTYFQAIGDRYLSLQDYLEHAFTR